VAVADQPHLQRGIGSQRAPRLGDGYFGDGNFDG